MQNIIYEPIEGTSQNFQIETDEQNQIIKLSNPKDSHQMNWIKSGKKWGTIKCGYNLSVNVARTFTEENTLLEEYVFRNDTEFDIYTLSTDLGIYTPFPDYYTDAAVCMIQCCNTHLWCQGNSSYIMALRMGGEAPHLGMVLREGCLQGYSVERPVTEDIHDGNISNCRGEFILHPENICLRPGESYKLSWEVFWFEDKEQFRDYLKQVPDFVSIDAENFVVVTGEKIEFQAVIGGNSVDKLTVLREGKQVPYTYENGLLKVSELPKETGEYHYEIIWNGKKSLADFLVISTAEELAGKRCRFIAEKQQCHCADSHLDGAYLVYDNEENQQYYSHRNDHNGGRERVGMGALLALYLQKHKDTMIEKSLDQYVEYVLRELFDEETGDVFNDMQRCQSLIRMYNYPWVAVLFMEMYKLKKDEVFLDRLYLCMEAYYRRNGDHFYAIGIPMEESVRIFKEAGRDAEAEKLTAFYRKHADYLMACGKNYPAHEVAYEQSIVSPAANYLCEVYRITGEEKYREAAREQIEVLDLFQGFQPDYHMNEVAIRHWDGYWFGKRNCLGDTFPHYWSALSGVAYRDTKEIMGSEKYARKAERTLRGVLSLFKEDGSASCAMVYPMSVNGQRAHYYDPWANDQDWGLYYWLKYSISSK